MSILVLEPRVKAANVGSLLVVDTIEFFAKNLHENRVLFSGEGSAFVLNPNTPATRTSRANQQ